MLLDKHSNKAHMAKHSLQDKGRTDRRTAPSRRRHAPQAFVAVPAKPPHPQAHFPPTSHRLGVDSTTLTIQTCSSDNNTFHSSKSQSITPTRVHGFMQEPSGWASDSSGQAECPHYRPKYTYMSHANVEHWTAADHGHVQESGLPDHLHMQETWRVYCIATVCSTCAHQSRNVPSTTRLPLFSL